LKNENAQKGKIAFVTGAAGALGAAIARAMIRRRASCRPRRCERGGLEELARELGPAVLPLPFDVSVEAEAKAACDRVSAEWGDVDILVNNAGILSNNKIAETTSEEWRRIHAINLDGPYFLCRRWAPGMRERRFGRIINICSVAMKTGGLTAGTAYTTSKGPSVLSPSPRARARAARSHGERYCSRLRPQQDGHGAARRRAAAEALQSIPVRRFCEPEEVAHVVTFLSSPLAGFITGEIVDINGGLHLD
jgi:3-oxoacyl-[acyl-carrier protein] reductase